MIRILLYNRAKAALFSPSAIPSRVHARDKTLQKSKFMRLDLLFKPVKSESELKVAMASCGFAFLRKFPCYSVASGRKSHSVAALEVESSDQQNQLKISYPKTPFLPSIVCELHVLLNLILDERGIFSLCTTAPSVPVYYVHRLGIFSVARLQFLPGPILISVHRLRFTFDYIF